MTAYSERTIHYWIAKGQLDRDLVAGGTRYASRPRANHKLDPYKAIINTRLEEFPRLSAQRLFDEVREAGYTGAYGRVRDYVHGVRPRDPVEPVVRFETPPGRQGQVDFGTFTLPWGRRHALLVVLGHSRLLWLRFYPRQTMAVLIDGLERAFTRFGGVPQELLFDQMRSVVLSDGPHRWRRAGPERGSFCAFAAHWGFMPRSCRPYRAQTKGKVERPIRYLRESFFYGRTFVSDADLNEQATRWLEGTANVRRHGTTGERPVDRFERRRAGRTGPAGRAALPTPRRHTGRGTGTPATARCGSAAARAGRLRRGRAMKASAKNRRDRVRAMLADLKMPGALEAVDGILAQADSGGATASEAIEQLLSAQIVLRKQPAPADCDAILPAAGGEDARRVRLRLPAQHQARADREPA